MKSKKLNKKWNCRRFYILLISSRNKKGLTLVGMLVLWKKGFKKRASLQTFIRSFLFCEGFNVVVCAFHEILKGLRFWPLVKFEATWGATCCFIKLYRFSFNVNLNMFYIKIEYIPRIITLKSQFYEKSLMTAYCPKTASQPFDNLRPSGDH